MSPLPPSGQRWSEAALKTRYCAQMLAAACVLAETAPDDFRRRVLARSVLVYCHEFIRWARRAKNEVRRDGLAMPDVRTLGQALDDLERRDWGDYEEIRHRIAAHRQTIGTDIATTMTANPQMWNDLSADALRILAEDVRAIWNRIAAPSGIPTLDTFPPISDELRASIDARGYEPVPAGVAVGGGSFDATRPDAALTTQGGALGEQNRQLVDAIRSVRTLSQLWQAVNGSEPYWRLVLSATVTDACALLDLTYERPAGSAHQQPALLELLERDIPSSLAIPVLRAGRKTLDAAAVAYVRDLRNRCAAHIDDQLEMGQISTRLRDFEADKLNAVLDNCFATLTEAARMDIAVQPILLHDAVMSGLELVDEPEWHRPYGRGASQ